MNRILVACGVLSLTACGPDMASGEDELSAVEQALPVCYPDCPTPEPVVQELVTNGGFQAAPDLSGWSTFGFVKVVTAGGGFCAVGDRCAVLGSGGYSYSTDLVRQSLALPSTAKKIQVYFSAYVYAFPHYLFLSGETLTVSLVDSQGRTVRTFKQVNPNNYFFESGVTGWKRFGPFDVTDLKGRTLRLQARVDRFYTTDTLQWRLDGVTAVATF